MRQLMTLTLMSARYAANMTSGRWQSDGKHHRKKKDLLNDEHENSTKTSRVSLQQLYALIMGVAHDDVPLAVDQNAVGMVKLPVFTAFAADGSHVAAVAVAQHLHSMIIGVGYNDVACTVKRDAVGPDELTSAGALAAYSAHVRSVAAPQHLHPTNPIRACLQ